MKIENGIFINELKNVNIIKVPYFGKYIPAPFFKMTLKINKVLQLIKYKL